MYGGGGRGGWRASKVTLSISVIIFNKKKKRESTAKSARVVRALLAHTRVLNTAEISLFFFYFQPLTRTAAPFTCVVPRTNRLLHVPVNIFSFHHPNSAYERTANRLAFTRSVWTPGGWGTYIFPTLVFLFSFCKLLPLFVVPRAFSRGEGYMENDPQGLFFLT